MRRGRSAAVAARGSGPQTLDTETKMRLAQGWRGRPQIGAALGIEHVAREQGERAAEIRGDCRPGVGQRGRERWGAETRAAGVAHGGESCPRRKLRASTRGAAR